MKKYIKRTIYILLTFVLIINTKITAKADVTASKYITTEEYCIEIAKQLDIKSERENDPSGYIDALISNGVITQKDLPSLKKNITRAYALVLINKADEYLNDTLISEDLINKVIEARISDIETIKKDIRVDVAKAYIKGFIKGYSNGYYVQSREIRGSKKITRTGALNMIAMLKDETKRSKVSPDGQLIRTTKLPNNAYMYPYILESFPNDYYERKLRFEGVTRRINGVLTPLEYIKDYLYPIDIDQATFKYIDDFEVARNQYMDLWMDKVKTHLETVLNINYKTVDQKWIDTLVSTLYYNNTIMEESGREDIARYIEDAKKNKTIVECEKVTMDASTMYYDDSSLYIRCYIKYKIVSSKALKEYSTDEFLNLNPYKGIFYSPVRGLTDMNGYEIGEWREEIYDICLSKYTISNEGYGFGVVGVEFLPLLFERIKR